jgi:hypothetical protein
MKDFLKSGGNEIIDAPTPTPTPSATPLAHKHRKSHR